MYRCIFTRNVSHVYLNELWAFCQPLWLLYNGFEKHANSNVNNLIFYPNLSEDRPFSTLRVDKLHAMQMHVWSKFCHCPSKLHITFSLENQYFTLHCVQLAASVFIVTMLHTLYRVRRSNLAISMIKLQARPSHHHLNKRTAAPL